MLLEHSHPGMQNAILYKISILDVTVVSNLQKESLVWQWKMQKMKKKKKKKKTKLQVAIVTCKINVQHVYTKKYYFIPLPIILNT